MNKMETTFKNIFYTKYFSLFVLGVGASCIIIQQFQNLCGVFPELIGIISFMLLGANKKRKYQSLATAATVWLFAQDIYLNHLNTRKYTPALFLFSMCIFGVTAHAVSLVHWEFKLILRFRKIDQLKKDANGQIR